MVYPKNVDESNRKDNILFKLFSTCHGAYKIENEIIGDSLDVEMQAFSGWQIENSQDPNI
jgi:cation-transporting ATPase 13A2